MKHPIIVHCSLFIVHFLAVLLISCKQGGNETTEDRPLSKEEVPNPVLDANPLVDYTKWEIKNGMFYLDGKRVFLKIGKPLINFADAQSVDRLISYLDTYRQKYYNVLELNCYWHHFDEDGDGEIEKSLAPLNKLIDAIYAKGMYPCLSVETYAVGGGTIPAGFWTRHPDADAIDSNGHTVNDTEYGFGSRVVSLFHPGYLETTRKYIRNLASGIDTRKILWFETSVEPQYMGTINLCYSDAAKREYENWRAANNITDEASKMPASFPIPESFIQNQTWNKFRAQWLAGWVNGEAAAYRDIAGPKAYVAVDYLDAGESEQIRRDGDPVEFLTCLTGADIIQVNWSWYFPSNAPNQKAYDRVREAMSKNGKDWAITEHMTFNGSDFVQYNNETLERILENTLANGTRLGWEFTNVMPSSADNFCLYRNDFSGKHVINIVDNYWGYWLYRIEEIEKKLKPQYAEGEVVTFDLKYLSSMSMDNPEDVATVWDHVHTVATLQGVVNRHKPQLYIYYVENAGINIDRYWWDKYRADGKWLCKAVEKPVADLVALVAGFKNVIKGAVVYDPQVAATSNLASSIAGIEDLIAVRYDVSPNSLYTKLIVNGPKIPVKVWLLRRDGASLFTGEGKIPGTAIASSGSTKIDAYQWFIEKYLKTGKCNTRFAAYYIDQYWMQKPKAAPVNHHTLTNHDFFVSRKAFFFDLSPWADEKATDDNRQEAGADRKLLEEMLLTAYRQNDDGKVFTYIGGFPAWAYKYTHHAGGSHDDVPTEWEFSRLIGAYNAFKDADAIGYGALANASFWQHYPLRTAYTQPWTSKAELQAKGYLDAKGKLSLGKKQLLVFYVGDYDASAWLSQTTPTLWDSPARGKVPMMWSISPVLSERVPMAWEYRRETATANDFFVAADNGAGYLNPGELQTPRLSGLPDATRKWAEHCKPYYNLWGLTVTGFVIDGYAEGLSTSGLDAYRSFSPNGIVPQKIPFAMLHHDMPVLRSDRDIIDRNPAVAAAQVLARVKARGIPFHWFRNILKSPEWYVQVMEELHSLDPNIELVDAPTFFELLRIYLGEEAATGSE